MAAPAGASGSARFEKDNAGVAVAATIQQLGPGTYRLTAVRKSDRSAVLLGTFVVADPTAGPDRNTSDNKNQRSSAHQSEGLATRFRVPLPARLAPADIAEIDVSGRGGVLLLFGKPRVVGNSTHPGSGS